MKKLVIDWTSYNSIQELPEDVREKYYNASKSNVLDVIWDSTEKNINNPEIQITSHNNSYSKNTVSQVLDTFVQNKNYNNSNINAINKGKQIEILKEDFTNDILDDNSQNNNYTQKSEYNANPNINSFLHNLIVSCMSFYSDSKYIFWLIISMLVLIFLFIFIIN